MNVDFNSRAELASYSHCRKLIDIERYARHLMMLGDVFPNDRDGVYLYSDGTCISDFALPSFYYKNRRKVYIESMEDFDKAVGVIYGSREEYIMTIRRPGSLHVSEGRSEVQRAIVAAAALVGDILTREFNHLELGKGIKQWSDDVIYMEALQYSARRKGILSKVEDQIFVEIVRELEEYSWFEMFFEKSKSCYLVDVHTDIRIKQYYETLFDKQDEEEEYRRENGDGYGRIICT